MAEYSYPYDAGSGTTVDEAFWRAMTQAFLPSGVLGASSRDAADTSLKITLGTGGAGPTIQIGVGEAWKLGIKYTNDAPLTKTASNNTNSSPRIDRFALKLDVSANTMTAVIVQGTPSGTPVPPTLVDTATVFYLPLGRATCPGVASAQNYSNFVDERAFIGGRRYVGPANGQGQALQQGDEWFMTDNKELLRLLGSSWVGGRQKLFNGVQAASSGASGSLPVFADTNFARIDIPAQLYPYQIQFSAHIHVLDLPDAVYASGMVKEGDMVTGPRMGECYAVAKTGVINITPLSVPMTKATTFAAGTARTFWFNVVPSVGGSSFSWVSPETNWFTATLTPLW